MLNFIRLFAVLLVFLAPQNAHAQDAAAPADKTTVAVDADALKNLITTLESETARNELLGNLKTLLEQQQSAQDTPPEEEAIAPITKTLGVDSFTTRVVTKYEAFLDRNDLKGSTVGKVGLSLIIALIGVTLIYISRRGATRILYWVDRAVTWLHLPGRRIRFYARILRVVVTTALLVMLAYTLTVVWDLEAYNPFRTEWFKTGLRTALNVGFVVLLATIVWEGINATVQMIFRRLDGAGSQRVNTILPIVRNVLFIVFAILFALMLLSELGINVVPLMAGAGIVGVAVGFGAQNMVKDFISGFTILLEDVVRVGDVAAMAGHGGVVEKITLRKIQLRDFDGSVYTIPFSEIKTITNRTKDFSFYVFDLNISYREDTDKVIDVMREVGEGLRSDPSFTNDIIEPLEVVGVDRFTDSSVVIKARIKTQPLRQWAVGREYNRRIKKAFDAHSIEIPFPQQVTWNMGPPPIELAKLANAGSEKPA